VRAGLALLPIYTIFIMRSQLSTPLLFFAWLARFRARFRSTGVRKNARLAAYCLALSFALPRSPTLWIGLRPP
jgi:hypothetical protein